MKNSKSVIKNWRLFFCLLYLALGVSGIAGQSTRVESPTPVTTNELRGRIAARDIGDSRLTTYYYVFNGSQGDIFLKVRSSNLNGDIDIFYAENMRPLTKISLDADLTTDTGREIYLRKPEKLILRVEGRSPNDDPATFSIRFEGSFQAINSGDNENDAEIPRLRNEVSGAVRVNSVGTIIEPERKPEPEESVTVAKKPSKNVIAKNTASEDDEKNENKNSENENLNRKRVANSETAPKKTVAARTSANKTATAKNNPTARRPARTPPAKSTSSKPTAERKASPAKSAAERKAEELATALENVRLVVLMKNGEKIDRPMSDVLRFSVDQGILTVISKKGAISRYSILDVAKVSIE